MRRGVFHAITEYEKNNNKYLRHYRKEKISSYLIYWDVNNLHRWVMSQELPKNNLTLIGVDLLGVRFVVGRLVLKLPITPCLKLVTIMVET